jgi:hypothetical protein
MTKARSHTFLALFDVLCEVRCGVRVKEKCPGDIGLRLDVATLGSVHARNSGEEAQKKECACCGRQC